MPTRSEVYSLYSQYAGNGNDFNTRLDLVRSELLPMGNWKGTKKPVLLTIYTDVDGRFIVTLPRQLQTILAGKVTPQSGLPSWCLSVNLPVRNGWYEFLPSNNWSVLGLGKSGFNQANGAFCTFQDWTGPMRLRFRFDVSEPQGKLLVRGTSNGTPVYTGSTNGEEITFSGNGPADSVNLFDARDLYVVKPVTRGRVRMYTVTITNGGTETLVAIYDPNETLPRWKRYFVWNIPPTDPNVTTTNQYLAICKIAYQRLSSDDDEVIPGNLSAIQRGFEALKRRDAADYKREGELWQQARACLIDEREDDEGAGAAGNVQVDDIFCVSDLNDDCGWPGGY